LAAELTAVLEVLAKDDVGVLQGPPNEVFGPSVPCVYRRGGLNFVNRVLGGVLSRSGTMWVSAHRRGPYIYRYAKTHMGGIATTWKW
jgi:hypothetical protein